VTRIYLDHNATTPLDPRVADAMQPYLRTRFGNPSSPHWAGREAADAVTKARAQVARAFGIKPSEVLFTSSGTESLSTAIRCALSASNIGSPRVVVSQVEHPAVLAPCRFLRDCGVMRLTEVAVDGMGRLSPEAFADAVTDDTGLVAVMRANNETGNLYDTAAIASAVRAKNPNTLVLVDAVQAAGKMALTLESCGADMLAISGHKLYGPMGVGALLIRRGSLNMTPWLMGGPQEGGRRGGTENVPGIVGLGAACSLPMAAESITALTERLRNGVLSAIEGVYINGDPSCSLPGTVNFRFDDIDAEELLIQLDLAGIAASSGAACASGTKDPSHVLLALALTPAQVNQSIRFSLGRGSSDTDVDTLLALLPDLVARVRTEK
jgi:cysteine desulfurase